LSSRKEHLLAKAAPEIVASRGRSGFSKPRSGLSAGNLLQLQLDNQTLLPYPPQSVGRTCGRKVVERR